MRQATLFLYLGRESNQLWETPYMNTHHNRYAMAIVEIRNKSHVAIWIEKIVFLNSIICRVISWKLRVEGRVKVTLFLLLHCVCVFFFCSWLIKSKPDDKRHKAHIETENVLFRIGFLYKSTFFLLSFSLHPLAYRTSFTQPSPTEPEALRQTWFIQNN